MAFNINLDNIALEAFREIPMESNLVPSRVFLKERAETYFNRLLKHGFRNLSELVKALKAKGGTEALAEQTGIPVEYLSVLSREIKGYIRVPIKLDNYPGLKVDTASKLAKAGLVNALHLFDQVLTKQSRAELASQVNMDEQELLKVTKLVDLTRIRWVNQTFAYAIYEAGFDTVAKVAKANSEDMYMRIKKVNEERQFFPAHLGLADIKRCIDFAQLVPLDIAY